MYRSFVQRRTRLQRLRGMADALRRPRNQVLVGLAGAGFGYYWYNHLDYVPYTNRRRMINVSKGTEFALGAQQFEQLKLQMGNKMEPAHSMASERVRRVGLKIAAAADQPDFHWEFAIFDAPEPNAFCMPGGKIGVFTGLLDLAKSDDELAAVVAHEVGHAVARHSAERMSQTVFLVPLFLALSTVIDSYMVNSLLVSLFVELPASRKQESEADYIGLKLMTKACYNPKGCPSIFVKLGEWAEQQPVKVPEYLSTHPKDKRRVADINKLLPESLDEYRVQCQGRQFVQQFGGDWGHTW